MKLFIKSVCAAGILAFVGCSTLKNSGSELYSEIDFTVEDALNDEIASVNKLSEKNIIKSLWRSYLLLEKFPENENLLSLYGTLTDKVFALYSESLQDSGENKPDYYAALKYRNALECVSWNQSGKLMPADELKSLAYKNVPGLRNQSASVSKIAQTINGTVTVYVDKGIKIERGMGRADSVLGSGFFISKDGYIVTNHHVISDMVDKKYEGFSRLYIKLAEDPDTRIPAKVVGFDKTLDLALLKTEIEAPYVFSLGSSSDLSVGDKVFAIGSPLGLEKTLTSGIISSQDRSLFTAGTVFQVDAAINSGNSGGPLIDEQGRVQAIVFAGVSNYQGLNFAIPVEYLKNELPFLYAGGEREHPWVSMFGKTQRSPGAGTRNEGVAVNYVLPGGSGNLAGIEENDVIVGADSKTVESLDDLKLIFMQQQSGSLIPLSVLKNSGDVVERIVYLDKRPSSPGYDIYRRDVIGNALYPILGMRLVKSSTVNKKKYNVVDVIKGSSADMSGFSEGDPVELIDVDFNEDKTAAFVSLYAKKRKNGYLDVSISLGSLLDSPFYF